MEALSYFLRNNNPWKLVVVVLAFKKLNFGGKGRHAGGLLTVPTPQLHTTQYQANQTPLEPRTWLNTAIYEISICEVVGSKPPPPFKHPLQSFNTLVS